MHKNALLFLLITLLAPALGVASTVYTYTGNQAANGDYITIAIELADPLQPSTAYYPGSILDWTASGGPLTLQPGPDTTNVQSVYYPSLGTDSTGQIVFWWLTFQGPGYAHIFSTHGYEEAETEDGHLILQVETPGTWAEGGSLPPSGDVPEPGSIALAGLGGLALLVIRRKRSV